jgi:uncharacterized metal-binding protein
MQEQTCCSTNDVEQSKDGYETILLEKTKKSCALCENYVTEHTSKPIAIVCCEGACLRGEIARQAANLLSYELAPEKTVRICLGSAFTKDTGQRNLVHNAPRIAVIEGCAIECASRMMKGVLPEIQPHVVIADTLYQFDRNLFGINEMPNEEIAIHARTVAQQVVENL